MTSQPVTSQHTPAEIATHAAAVVLANAAQAMRAALARNATAMVKVSYYPTLKRAYAALEATNPPRGQLALAAQIVQLLEVAAFGEAFTYSIDK